MCFLFDTEQTARCCRQQLNFHVRTFLVFQPFEKFHLTASKFIQQNI